jgi:hypothetical protein
MIENFVAFKTLGKKALSESKQILKQIDRCVEAYRINNFLTLDDTDWIFAKGEQPRALVYRLNTKESIFCTYAFLKVFFACDPEPVLKVWADVGGEHEQLIERIAGWRLLKDPNELGHLEIAVLALIDLVPRRVAQIIKGSAVQLRDFLEPHKSDADDDEDDDRPQVPPSLRYPQRGPLSVMEEDEDMFDENEEDD